MTEEIKGPEEIVHRKATPEEEDVEGHKVSIRGPEGVKPLIRETEEEDVEGHRNLLR
jgi:hypothetical protein